MLPLSLSNPGLVGIPHQLVALSLTGGTQINLYEQAVASGWGRSYPVSVTCTVAGLAGGGVGAGLVAAISSTGFYSGSNVTLTIANTSAVRGMGGNGGPIETDGADGAAAIWLTYPTKIINSGLIYGGGGGGGGGDNIISFGGGGGGAGSPPGDGGSAPLPGSAGTLTAGGAGGGGAGAGGGPGENGAAGYGYNGGFAGYWIYGSGNGHLVSYSGPGTGGGNLA